MMTMTAPKRRSFVLAILASGLWLNASEVVRYFGIVMPATRSYLAMVPGVAPMNWGVFSMWGLWDTILLGLNLSVTWLVAERIGYTLRAALIGGSIGWLFFPLFWLGMINLRLSDPMLMLWTMPWSWIEFVVSSAIFVMISRR